MLPPPLPPQEMRFWPRHCSICGRVDHVLNASSSALMFLQVLQRPLDLELELLSDPKDPKSLVGRVFITCLSSQPIDREDVTKRVTGNYVYRSFSLFAGLNISVKTKILVGPVDTRRKPLVRIVRVFTVNQQCVSALVELVFFLWFHCAVAARAGRGQEYSDEDEEFSSGEDASDSEPTLENRRRKKNIATGNARVRASIIDFCIVIDQS